eukprot:Sspe_Gene.57161::Locus_31387_Transcript_1_1_Confidence_1.000_Length_1471::g.57161::m.57161
MMERIPSSILFEFKDHVDPDLNKDARRSADAAEEAYLKSLIPPEPPQKPIQSPPPPPRHPVHPKGPPNPLGGAGGGSGDQGQGSQGPSPPPPPPPPPPGSGGDPPQGTQNPPDAQQGYSWKSQNKHAELMEALKNWDDVSETPEAQAERRKRAVATGKLAGKLTEVAAVPLDELILARVHRPSAMW